MSHTGHLWELRYTEGSSFKFYRVYTIENAEAGDYRVLFQWGRIGTRGQSKVETFSSPGAMTTLAVEKRDEKRRKGYEIVHQSALQFVPPDVLKAAAVNERYQVQSQQVVDTNLIAAMMSKLDGAVRLATGTTDDQAQAVVVSQDLRSNLDDLRKQVLELEAGVEVLDDLIVHHLGR